jgi:hypothetical protein
METTDNPTMVQIIGAPIACTTGIKDTWRETAAWAAGQLHARFGDQVRVEYFDLFDPACPPLPPHAQLPVIIVSGELLRSGGKVAIPLIRRRLEALGVMPAER